MSSLRIDSDVIVFLLIVGRILTTGLYQLRRNLPFIPAEYGFEEVPLENLTKKQVEFLGRFDEKLLAMNYRPVCTYRVRNYVPNLLRMYVNPADRASCKVLAVETRTNVNGVENRSHSSLVAFRTNYTDGKSLTTRNMRLRTVLDQPPEYLVQECPNVHDLAVLKSLHDARAAHLGIPVAPEATAARVFEYYQREHHRFSEFQVERGTYLRANGGYRVSSKAHWRGIRDFLVPFSQRFSAPRLASAAILGVGLPSLTYLRLLPLVIQRTEAAGLNPDPICMGVLAASYVLAGAAVGLLLETNGFVWGFLLTSVGVHLVTGWWFSAVPFGALAGALSHTVAQLRKEQKLIFRPSAAS